MIEIESNKKKDYQSILTDDAINFLEKICSTFESSRQEILENREVEIAKKDFKNY